MTLNKPTLILRKLRLHKGAISFYEADFHEGLNIIRGQNGSGKSTITELIFYALGGEMTEWKNPANSCDGVYAEVEINGYAATFYREITPGNANAGMEIFWGSMVDAELATRAEWQKYPYRSTENKDSFSQKIFSSLEFPQVRNEETSNITLNQVLRLIYADQLTPGARIFRLQEKWDSGLLRQTVGDLLCGVYDDELYEAKLALNRKNKELEAAITQLRNIFSVLGKAEQDIGFPNFEEQASSINHELTRLHDQIGKHKESGALIDGRTAAKVEKIEKENLNGMSKLSEQILALSEEAEELRLDSLDSTEFITELRRRRDALIDSQDISKYLGHVRFALCPCCMSPVATPTDKSNVNTCDLCKSDLSDSDHDLNLFRMKNELEVQIRESEVNLQSRANRTLAISNELRQLSDLRKEVYRSLKGYSKQWPTEIELKIDNANIEIGKLNQELIGLREKQKLYDLIKVLQDDRQALNNEVIRLKDVITSRQSKQDSRRVEAYGAIEDFVVEILHQDLKRQDDFSNATKASIDFDGNSILVNGIKTFSASSLVLLKNSFHLAFLLASTTKDFFRYPRLLILDGIEDGGMEDIRSHNFQEILKKYSDGLHVTHQIIFTTAKLSPKLNDPKYLIGPAYTELHRTLNPKIVTKA